MEEPILHENTRISPIMLSVIVHCTLVLLFIIEMNMADTSLPAQREAEVIMMPEEQSTPISQTALAPEPISSSFSQPEAEKEEENVLKNFPSFKQLPNTPDASEYDDFDAAPPQVDESTENLEEVIQEQSTEQRDEPAPAPAQPLAANAPALTPQQHPTSLFDDIEHRQISIDQNNESKTKQLATKLQVQQQQKKLSLADIGKRYQEYLHEERASNAKGIAGVTILGDDNAIPTGEQIKHARFMEKISAQVQKAWSRLRHNLHNPGEYTAEFFVMLNKNGSLKTFKLRKTSGSAEVDTFITRVYEDASSAFPPIPESFKLESYGFNIMVTLYPYIDQGPMRFSSSWK